MSAAAHELDRLQGEVDALLARLADAEARWQPWTTAVAAENHCSAINLVHHSALRQVDLRDLQERLTGFGLSSLVRSEAHVQATLQLVSAAIGAMRGQGWTPGDKAGVEVAEGTALLHRNAVDLLGPTADDQEHIVRIDCAQDDTTTWKTLAANARSAAAAAAGHPCLVTMVLAGPNPRTGPLEPGPQVARLRPTRNAYGQVVAAGRGWLTSTKRPARPPEPGLVTLPVDAKWLAHRAEGDELLLRDTRGSKRQLLLAAAAPGGFVVTTEKTTYLGTGTRFKAGKKDSTKLGELPAVEQSIPLAAGDVVKLTRDCKPAPVDEDRAPRIGCTLPEVFANAEAGQRISFDDGELGGTVIAVGADSIRVRIDQPAYGTAQLRADTAINLPDTDLLISAPTDKDLADLPMVIELGDIVELSVRDPADVTRLFDELDRLGSRDLGVVLTVENRLAADELTQLLLSAMRRRRVGVAISPGDPAEETRSACAAAHLPVIRATN